MWARLPSGASRLRSGLSRAAHCDAFTVSCAIGVRVCAIAPGTMGTPLLLGAPESITAPLVESIIFPKRMGRPEEFALLVESIATNPYLNGENIRLDGALRFPPK